MITVLAIFIFFVVMFLLASILYQQMITVLAVFIFFVIMFLLASILYQQIGLFKWFFHDVLDWHMPNGHYNFDGVNLSSRCKYCGKEITQDSQGNWF